MMAQGIPYSTTYEFIRIQNLHTSVGLYVVDMVCYKSNNDDITKDDTRYVLSQHWNSKSTYSCWFYLLAFIDLRLAHEVSMVNIFIASEEATCRTKILHETEMCLKHWVFCLTLFIFKMVVISCQRHAEI